MYITVDAEVDIDDILDDVDDDVLIDVLQKRGKDFNTIFVDGEVAREKLERIWLLRREGKNYDAAVDDLIYYVLGKVI